MNSDVELEGRPRPLSTGLWTLFSWLRREERSDSSESLSSAGSDRTVASFSFLTPAHYRTAATPLVLPPPGPPTDSYKKRVHDRNIRRQHDRDITLHRKYGLLKSGEPGYDAFSLPPARRLGAESSSRWDRDRRATSECYQRRLAHVPGKRRAPLPPVTVVPSGPSTSLNRRNTRKRRAPQPPLKVTVQNKENLKVEENNLVKQMNPQLVEERQTFRNSDVTMGCKPEKYSKKEGQAKETKLKPEKSFLKQIFDSKKRNSGIDISSIKILPSISELDKQAAEIIESYKLEKNNNVNKPVIIKKDGQSLDQSEGWICVTCLRKYDNSITTCINCLSNPNIQVKSATSRASSSYTQTENNLSSSMSKINNTAEEKQKLKEMLKEMKDSLPKRPKQVNDKVDIKSPLNPISRESSSYSTETPTLRVGCVIKPSTSADVVCSNSKTSPVILQAMTPVKAISYNKHDQSTEENIKPTTNIEINNVIKPIVVNSDQNKSKRDLHTPLRISSLLNPVYVPKNTVTNKPQEPSIAKTISNNDKIIGVTFNNPSASQQPDNPKPSTDVLATSQSRLPISTNQVLKKSNPEKVSNDKVLPNITQTNNVIAVKKEPANVNHNNKGKIVINTPKKEPIKIITEGFNLNQHTRRRDLILQLEQSIAKGDERAAAEAAAKLAQLRLSCSVLSFSSQILSQPSTSQANSVIESGNCNISKEPVKVQVPVDAALKDQTQPSVSKSNTTFSETTAAKKTNASLEPTQITVLNTPKSNACVKDRTKKEDVAVQKSTPELKKANSSANNAMTTIAVLVEDREATRGPVHLRINRQALMRDLRREAEISLGLPTHLQRWIVGRALCVNDDTPIISLAGTDFSAPFYLCVVEAEKKSTSTSGIKEKEKLHNDQNKTQTKASAVYTELVELEQQALVPNAENFECGVCMEEYTAGNGVVLRECVHIFCRECLADVVRHCDEPDIPCPAMGCPGTLQEREIRALVTLEEYERWLARGLAAAESGTRNAFHCRTRDCKGWALCDPEVLKFPCPVCKCVNCVPCQAIHDGLTCDQHRAKLKQAAAGKSGNANNTDDSTRTLLNSLIAKGEALECPECSAIITKKWGCDWVKCSACKTEICWVTRGRRWGPGGKGDTSGGCRCGIDGKRCHPSCGYCH